MSFDYTVPVPATDPNCKLAFTPSFHHQDWLDGVDVVQAQQTPNEDGFNLRFHRIEQDIAALASDISNALNCVAVLRLQIIEVLAEIKLQFNLPPAKTSKESKDVKDFKDGKDGKDGKDAKDTKDHKDTKDTKDVKDAKDGKDSKDSKDHKDDKDGKDGKEFKDGGGKEAENIPAPLPAPPMSLSGMAGFLWDDAPSSAPIATGHAFIRPHERPAIGERALKGAEDADR